MRAPLTDNGFLNYFSTARTAFSGALIYLEMVLEIPAAINPVNTGTMLLDCPGEYQADCGQERVGFLLRERTAGTQRMQPGAEQSLVRVNIPQTRDKALVQ